MGVVIDGGPMERTNHTRRSTRERLLAPAERFEQLYLDSETKLFRYLARRVGPTLAEDLTAEAFAIAWQRFADYDPARAAFSTWVFGIALNLLRRHSRTELSQLNVYSRTGSDPALPLDETAIVDRLVADAFWPKVAAELADMDAMDRDVLTLYAWAGMSYNAIAETLDVPVGTVRSRMSRARDRLVGRVGSSFEGGVIDHD
jgi:RNA polymerase sigma-70 factor (ECF subfamily)